MARQQYGATIPARVHHGERERTIRLAAGASLSAAC